MPFINLHTHRKPQSAGELAIRNAFHAFPQVKLATLPYPVSAGIHPLQLLPDFEPQLQALHELSLMPQVIAIGECGLDRVKGPAMAIQEAAFDKQITLANSLHKPVILHLVKAYADVLNMASRIRVPWIVHGFHGNAIQAEQLLSKGASLSLGHRWLHADDPNAFAHIPLDRLYLETDVRPIRIENLYTAMADRRKMDLNALKTRIALNFARDFPHYDTRYRSLLD
jgi:TatD DNase family protein